MDNKTKILIFFPFVLVIILAVTANYIPFDRGLSATEESVSRFRPANIAIKEIQRIDSVPDIKGPLDFNYSAAGNSSPPDNDLVSDHDLGLNNKSTDLNKSDDKVLSLIIISGGNRSAIIKGVPVKEGDTIADMKIVKIQHDRVLLKDKTLKWMYLE
jgi:hypothetical protein